MSMGSKVIHKAHRQGLRAKTPEEVDMVLAAIFYVDNSLKDAKRVIEEGLKLPGLTPTTKARLQGSIGFILVKRGSHREAIPYLRQAVAANVAANVTDAN